VADISGVGLGLGPQQL